MVLSFVLFAFSDNGGDDNGWPKICCSRSFATQPALNAHRAFCNVKVPPIKHLCQFCQQNVYSAIRKLNHEAQCTGNPANEVSSFLVFHVFHEFISFLFYLPELRKIQMRSVRQRIHQTTSASVTYERTLILRFHCYFVFIPFHFISLILTVVDNNHNHTNTLSIFQ